MDINNIKPVGAPVLKPGNEPGAPAGGPSEAGQGGQVSLPGQVKLEPAIQPKEVREEDLKAVMDKMNQTAQIFDRSLKFQIHEETNTMMVAVVDTNSNKVIREIPPKEILDMFARMQDYLGLIFDKKV